MSDGFSVQAVHSKPWPAPPLYRPPSHLPNDGLPAGPGAPHKKWGVSQHPGALVPEMLAAAEPRYLRKDAHQAHPQDGEADSSQDTGASKAGSTQAPIRERSFLADVDVGT